MDKKRLGSFVIGGVAGLLAGILIAPKSGRETRGSFADRAGEARQRSSETYFDARERLRERISATGGDSPRNVHQDTFGGEPAAPVPEPANVPEPPRKPVLRDVSRSEEISPEPREAPAAEGSRPDELRRRIRETRERLKESGASGNGGADDPR